MPFKVPAVGVAADPNAGRKSGLKEFGIVGGVRLGVDAVGETKKSERKEPDQPRKPGASRKSAPEGSKRPISSEGWAPAWSGSTL